MDYSLSPQACATRFFNEAVTSTTLPGATEDYQGRMNLMKLYPRSPCSLVAGSKSLLPERALGGLILLPSVGLTIYAKNVGIDGTWHESRYPELLSFESDEMVIY